MALKTRSQRGSWFVTVGEKTLPCVHKEWFYSNKSGKAYYFDIGIVTGSSKKCDAFIDTIIEGKEVILAEDEWNESGNFDRARYIGIFKVDNIIADETGIRFDFIERIGDVK